MLEIQINLPSRVMLLTVLVIFCMILEACVPTSDTSELSEELIVPTSISIVSSEEKLLEDLDSTESVEGDSISVPSSEKPLQSGSGTLTNFERLLQGDSLIAGLMEPTLLIVGDRDQAMELEPLFDDAAVVEQIERVNYSEFWLLAVFGGEVASSGYSVTVEELSFASDMLDIRVIRTEPDPDRMVSAVISYPFELILVPRTSMNITADTTWVIFDGATNP